MKTFYSAEINEVMQATHYRPSLSIILPLEHQRRFSGELDLVLKATADKVEVELSKDYPSEICQLMMKKLRKLTVGIKAGTRKRSLAIYVSPIFEKVLFMDSPVQERIVIDESFEIRDLIYDKKQDSPYLLLILSAKLGQMYLGNIADFRRIPLPVPESIYAYINEWPESVANFTDATERKQIVIHKFVQHMDKALGNIINEYPLPIFVLGTEKILGHFRKHTKHTRAIAAYITGDYRVTNFSRLREIIEPHLALWQHRKLETILDQIESAAGKKKLTSGIKPVWNAVMNNIGHHLVVESNFVCAAHRGAQQDVIEPSNGPFNEISFFRDAVDDIIEKVMTKGGDVDFVEPGALKDHGHIALVNY